MRFLTVNGNPVPAHGLGAIDDTDFYPRVFEDRPLFDMQFEVGAEPTRPNRFVSGVTRGFQDIAKQDSLGIL